MYEEPDSPRSAGTESSSGLGTPIYGSDSETATTATGPFTAAAGETQTNA
jgi:hypothetical protein